MVRVTISQYLKKIRYISKDAEIPHDGLLSFECSPCAICDARSQFGGVSGVWVTKIRSRKLTFEHGSVTQMGCRMLDGQEALRLFDNGGEELVCLVYRRRDLRQPLEIKSTLWATPTSSNASMKCRKMGIGVFARRAELKFVITGSYAIILGC